jgi:hypothetical protein
MSTCVGTCNTIKQIFKKIPDQNLEVFTFMNNRMFVLKARLWQKAVHWGRRVGMGVYFIREMVDTTDNATSFCKLRRYYT